MKGEKRAGKIDDRYTIKEAIRWIDKNKNKPFFCYINLQNSHIPYEVPSDFEKIFSPKRISFPLRFNYYPKEHIQTVKDMYADSLRYVDFQLGKLISYLKKSGEWEKTVFVVTGDTGQAFFEHGFSAHANMLFNEVMKVPLVIYAPDLPPKIDQRLSQHIDIPPTILDLMGLPPHPGYQGKSLLDEEPKQGRSVYLLVQSPLSHQYAIVKDGFKYIFDARLNRDALFNLTTDPMEKINDATNYPDVFAELKLRLNIWREKQIAYYNDSDQHSRLYPPMLED